MTVKELIVLLQTKPQDAVVITTMCSDFADVDAEHITVIDGKADYEKTGTGLIRHRGHLMELRKEWWPGDGNLAWNSNYNADQKRRFGDRPEEPEFVTAVHFAGN